MFYEPLVISLSIDNASRLNFFWSAWIDLQQQKNQGDVRTYKKFCEFSKCESSPNFGPKGGKAKRCGAHRNPNDVDVKHKQCNHENCTVRARFGFIGHVLTHCATHVKAGQTGYPKRVCVNCKDYAVFGTTSKPERCKTHALPHDRNFVQQHCISCKLVDIVGNDGKCSSCDPKVIAAARLRKQREVHDFLCTSGLPPFETYDRMLQSGACGKQRPDFTWASGVVLEVDEHQHKSYDQDCERIRMMDVTAGMGQPTLWVRYNPDECSGPMSGARCSDRQLALLQLLNREIQRPQVESRVVKLFYDGFTGVPEFEPLFADTVSGLPLAVV